MKRTDPSLEVPSKRKPEALVGQAQVEGNIGRDDTARIERRRTAGSWMAPPQPFLMKGRVPANSVLREFAWLRLRRRNGLLSET